MVVMEAAVMLLLWRAVKAELIVVDWAKTNEVNNKEVIVRTQKRAEQALIIYLFFRSNKILKLKMMICD